MHCLNLFSTYGNTFVFLLSLSLETELGKGVSKLSLYSFKERDSFLNPLPGEKNWKFTRLQDVIDYYIVVSQQKKSKNKLTEQLKIITTKGKALKSSLQFFFKHCIFVKFQK